MRTHTHSHAFGPAGGDVGQREGVDTVTVRLGAATVLDHVDLEEARGRIEPVGEGAHRDAATDRRAHSLAPLALSVNVRPCSGQHAVDGRRADLQNLGLDDRVKIEVPVPLHGIDQHRDQRLQALAADPIGSFPQDRQGLGHRLVVNAVAQAHVDCWAELSAKYADRVLAVVAGESHEFVEDLDPITERRAAISQSQCLDQLLACGHADLPRHVAPPPPDHPTGSRLCEATGQHG